VFTPPEGILILFRTLPLGFMIKKKAETSWIDSFGCFDQTLFNLKMYLLYCSRSQEFDFWNLKSAAWSMMNQAAFLFFGV
jgi:hypothetical protein